MLNSKFKILILDDNQVELNLMKMMLLKKLPFIEYHGLNHAPNWQEFLVGNHFDAIVIDYRLLGKNGFEEVKEIRKVDQNIPIYLISNLSEDEINLDLTSEENLFYIFKDRGYNTLIKFLTNLFITA